MLDAHNPLHHTLMYVFCCCSRKGRKNTHEYALRLHVTVAGAATDVLSKSGLGE